MSTTTPDARELAVAATAVIPAPALPYQPRQPRSYRPRIGLIGCGGITKTHLAAYRAQGWEVVALCDVDETTARERQREFYPDATVFTGHHALLARPDIDVVDLATHPAVRLAQIEDALLAGKHVLSQKPFVLDLADGERLVALAHSRKLKLAVNQNGRWAPYFSYARELIQAGHLGEITAVDMTLAWDHTWIRGTAFERLHHVILADFAIHWFDMVACIFGERRAVEVFATLAKAPGQQLAPPMNAQVLITYPDGQATLAFRGHTLFGNVEHLLITGSRGLYQASGPVCAADRIRLVTAAGEARPVLTGTWFPDGMAGAMGELLCAIEDDREPENSAAANLHSLALCFAALESTRSGRAELPGTITRAGDGCTTG